MWECTFVWNYWVVSCERLGFSLLCALLIATSLAPSFPRYTSQEPPLPIHCVHANLSVIRDTSTKLYHWSWHSNPLALGVSKGVSFVDMPFCETWCSPCYHPIFGVTKGDPSIGVAFCKTCYSPCCSNSSTSIHAIDKKMSTSSIILAHM